MYKNKIIQTVVLVGAVLSIISVFLPLYKINYLNLPLKASESIYESYRSRGDIALTMIFMVAPALAGLSILLKKKIPVIVIILGSIQCVLWGITGALVAELIKKPHQSYDLHISYGLGFYLGVIGALLIIGGAVATVVTKAYIEPNDDDTLANDNDL